MAERWEHLSNIFCGKIINQYLEYKCCCFFLINAAIKRFSKDLYTFSVNEVVQISRSLVMSIFLYACKSWTLTAETEKRIQAMEMRCLRKLLGITYREHITNEEVRNRTRQAIGPHEDLLTSQTSKLRWYGHITRSSGLAKTVMQGTVQGGRRRGRQRKRWEDNIPEWTGLTLGTAMRKAERREEWRELVARTSVVPQWSTETTG